MDLLEISGLLITLAAVLAWFNHRLLGLPVTIGVMVVALLFSLNMRVLGSTVMPGLADWGSQLHDRVRISNTLLDGVLSFPLFAGTLFVDLKILAQRKYAVGLPATALNS